MKRIFEGIWINAGETMIPLVLQHHPAPLFRREFECGNFGKAVIRLCGLGYHELFVNGEKADDRILAPNPTVYDHRVSYIDYDVTHLLRPGRNAVAVLLGNGWYNCFNHDNEERAPWRDWPKLRCDVLADGKVVMKSDCSWKWHPSALTFDSLRCGEVYDARLASPGVSQVGFDDSQWENAGRAMPPGGELVEEDEEPCRVIEEFEPVAAPFALSSSRFVYDFGVNMAGVCEIEVEGTAGSEISLLHGEKIRPNGSVTVEEECVIVQGAPFQVDRYILKGSGRESYHPRFTYHGFRYVEVTVKGDAKVLKIKARAIRVGFASTGSVESSSATLNALQKMTRRSYEGNFANFPTDCPHREKNGWTGDAQLVCRTGCWNYNMQKGYRHFIRMLVDVQRTSGQLPGFTPTAGWGFNWGNGPTYDSALFEMTCQLWLFYNDTEFVREMYEPMRRYIAYLEDMEEADGILYFGLGDWVHPEFTQVQPAELFSTCYYYEDVKRMAEFAALLGKAEDVSYYTKLAEKIRKNFRAKFRNPDGSYGIGGESALAAVLYFDLAGDDAPRTAELLAKVVREHGHKAYFGIMGAKYVPRMLAKYGYVDDALEVFTQPEMPGWGHWVKMGSTTLWERWNGLDSHNHIMFGDVSAWQYEVLGGLTPLADGAGFRHVALAPHFPQKLDHFSMAYDSKQGRIEISWVRKGNAIEYRYSLPDGCKAELVLPGKPAETVTGKGVRVL